MTTRIGPDCRLGIVQTSSFRYHEHHFMEYMGSVDNCRLNDFLDLIPLSYFDEYFRHRDERYVDDVRNEDEAQLALNISAQIPIDTYISVSRNELERLVGKSCYCFDKNPTPFAPRPFFMPTDGRKWYKQFDNKKHYKHEEKRKK